MSKRNKIAIAKSVAKNARRVVSKVSIPSSASVEQSRSMFSFQIGGVIVQLKRE